ncbi:MAG: MFS transporter [Caldilineaceae bacterium]
MTFRQYHTIFQNQPFRWFWSGFTISVLGDGLSRVALTWFVYEATGSARALGWLALCYTGPIIVGGLMAGMLLDRFDPRRVMMVDNLVRGLVMLLIPLLYLFGWLALWHIYAVAAIYGLLMMISLAGGPTLVPALVPSGQLATANALEMLSFTIGGVISPVIAGLLIGWMGAPNVVALDALSYLCFAFCLTRVTMPAPTTPHADAKPRSGLSEAVQLLLHNPILLATTSMYLVLNIGSGFMAVWLPILADSLPGGGATLFGALLGVIAAGEVISALLVGSMRFRLPLGTLICLAEVLSGLALIWLPISDQSWLIGSGLFLFGFCSAPLTIWAQTLRMQIIPAHLRGRTFALLRMLMQSGNPLGGALAGGLFPVLGMSAMIALTALVIGAPGVVGYMVRTLRVAGVAPVAAEEAV